MSKERSPNEGLVEALHAEIKAMTVDFRLKPGERINEMALARALNASRTPLREALNRLVSEGFLTFESGKGFFCRKYSVTEVHNLYQVRQALERFAVQAAVELATDEKLTRLLEFLRRTEGEDGRSLEELLVYDEYFHETLAAFSGNGELVRMLKNINARIRFFRWVDMEQRRQRTQGEHWAILAAIASRDAETACGLMDSHISKRRDEIAQAVKECHARLFVDDSFVPPAFKSVDQLCV
jgi:DNA-binding GntR family transcriptional regulator